MLRARRSGLCLSVLIGLGVSATLAAQPSHPASPGEKLDRLLSTWTGQSLDRLRQVWGREQGVDLRRATRLYTFERRVKVRAAGLGVQVFGGGGLRCVAQFEIDDKDHVVRSYWQGGGARECWGAFRGYEP